MSSGLRIGMIGLDTSHSTAFTKLLNDEAAPFHVPGGRVTIAYPGGSPDFEMSWSRLDRFTTTVRDEYGVRIVESVEEVAQESDAILLTSVDGRVHLEQFRRIAPYGKPTFIDKPFAVSSADAAELFRLAEEHRVPLMSSSSLRFAEDLVLTLQDASGGDIIGADCYGPIELQPTQPGLFWYGIHCTEMLHAIMGRGCVEVHAVTNELYEQVTGIWADGRVGTIRGNRAGNRTNGALIHRTGGTQFADCGKHPKPKYAGLLERAMQLFQTGVSMIDPQETLAIIRFLEAANESRRTGATVRL
ncbi:Gfo/Idh/MocA family protein [Paenibacillus koleovorans]|uniref:Gfo/Idh/MocA family protein n=1 Tax=Paenibacillus koleovorans TaxID=121608 RepID=UPI000FD83298|nr:Gfo/Idh/MocA family oxidoreductase [Paenibacillus koleovorans]